MDYITQAEVEAYLGIALTDNGVALFNLLLPSMQDMIDDYCERTWNFTNPVTENFDAFDDGAAPYSRNTFFVSKPQISATPANSSYPQAGGVISVTVGGTPFDMQYVYNYKTYVKLGLSPSAVPLLNPFGYQSVVISYNSDAAGQLPNPVKLALIKWMAREMQTAPDAGKDTSQTQTGSVSVSYTKDMTNGIPDFVKMVLDSYRLPPIDRF